VPTRKRTRLGLEGERANRQQIDQLGLDLRDGRVRRGLTQRELGVKVGLSQSAISRVERGLGGGLTVDALQRAALALDLRLRLSLARDPLTETRDAGHLAMQELILRLGRLNGLSGSFELPTRPSEPWRSIDVCLADLRRSRRIVVECWNTIGDIGAAVRSSTRKRAELQALALAGGDPDAVTGLVWVVRATSRNRALVGRYPEVFARAFPGTSSGWVATLMNGRPTPGEPGLVWCDVDATRLFAWRRHVG
jgi:transcriptional regulator with XRE-family HTH domain